MSTENESVPRNTWEQFEKEIEEEATRRLEVAKTLAEVPIDHVKAVLRAVRSDMARVERVQWHDGVSTLQAKHGVPGWALAVGAVLCICAGAVGYAMVQAWGGPV